MQRLTFIKNKQTGNSIFNACIEFESTQKTHLEKKIKQQTAKSKQL